MFKVIFVKDDFIERIVEKQIFDITKHLHSGIIIERSFVNC